MDDEDVDDEDEEDDSAMERRVLVLVD